MATLPMAPANQESVAMVPMLTALFPVVGMTMYWLMQPVSPWAAWSHFMPLSQILIEPGYCAVLMQLAGCDSVVYSPTTWYHWPAAITPSTGCQSAAEPRPALGLKT